MPSTRACNDRVHSFGHGAFRQAKGRMLLGGSNATSTVLRSNAGTSANSALQKIYKYRSIGIDVSNERYRCFKQKVLMFRSNVGMDRGEGGL